MRHSQRTSHRKPQFVVPQGGGEETPSRGFRPRRSGSWPAVLAGARAFVPGPPGPSVLTPDDLLLLPAAGVFAELVDEPPAVHPLQDVPLVVVPVRTRGSEAPCAPGTPPGLAVPRATWPSGLRPHRPAPGPLPGAVLLPQTGSCARPPALDAVTWGCHDAAGLAGYQAPSRRVGALGSGASQPPGAAPPRHRRCPGALTAWPCSASRRSCCCSSSSGPTAGPRPRSAGT